MEVQYFLEERTTFLRYFYQNAAAPFLEIHRKIDAKEAPFEEQPYDPETMSDEPPYMEEWSDAWNGLNFLGRSCVSMLSGTIQLYFVEWEKLLNIKIDEADRRKVFKKGILGGYRAIFEEVLKMSWSDCGADLAILEQVTLARNNDQHPENIASLDVRHKRQDWQKHPKLFFISDGNRMALEQEGDSMFVFANRVEVTREKLYQAINELEQLVKWLEPQLMTLRYGNPTGFPIKEDGPSKLA